LQDASVNGTGARRIDPTDDEQSDATRPGAVSTGPPRLTPLRELQLVEAYRQGNADALSELLEAYQRRVYSVCYRMVSHVELAADLTQDVLIKIIEGLDRYDGRSRLSTWVYRIAVNCCLSHLRKQKLRRHGSLDEPVGGGTTPVGRQIAAEAEPAGPRHVEQAETRAILLRCLGELEPDMRTVLVLRDMHDLDYQQIAEVVEVPVGTVKSRLFRARAALREAVERGLRGDEEAEIAE
jgi:RNA polymerase sigma-70 factor (ECF subfamily)